MKRATVALLIVLASAAAARAENPEDVAARVSQEIMSPFCDGVTLHDCPSGAADELRGRIVRMARSGMSEQEIIAVLEDEYGDRIAAAPQTPISWIVPGIAALAGLTLAVILARRWTQRPARESREVSDEDRARVGAELTAHRGEP